MLILHAVERPISVVQLMLSLSLDDYLRSSVSRVKVTKCVNGLSLESERVTVVGCSGMDESAFEQLNYGGFQIRYAQRRDCI